ncbi:MAG TPA: KH domain-containing protein, partial [Bacilli bacterium]|nr:KH domain-containing protein [Bacilli bacterium]
IAEYVREKIFNNTNEEVPHSITCVTEDIKMNKESAEVNVLIVVERDSLKKIIIGKQGEMIKKIGIEARKDIEELMNRRVYLNLYVKTIPKWRDKEKYLMELGFKERK